jgi:Protein of unknown function (DUF4242)
VTGDELYCVHEAEDAEAVFEHARRGEFPADAVFVVANEPRLPRSPPATAVDSERVE